MAITETSRSVPFGAVATLHIVNMIESITENYLAWRNEHAQSATMRKLTDQQLRDIGLTDAQRPTTSWTSFAH